MILHNNIAVILAGGTGSRMGTKMPKQFLQLSGKPVIMRTLEVFENHPSIDIIYIVIHPDYMTEIQEILASYSIRKVSGLIQGGNTRQQSSWNALKTLKCMDNDIILFHDAARPLLNPGIIDTCISKTEIHGACTVAVRTIDTIAIANQDQTIISIPERALLWNIQTPQCFKYDLIYNAHKNAESGGKTNSSDDTQLVLENGRAVYLVEGDYDNIKITTPDDIVKAETFLKQQNKMIDL